MTQVRISKQAQRDVDAAASWYEAKREGLGFEFRSRVQEAGQAIQLNPEGYPIVFRDARRLQLRQFTNYALWFQIKPTEIIVIACLSGRRDPVLIRERVMGVIEMPKPESL